MFTLRSVIDDTLCRETFTIFTQNTTISNQTIGLNTLWVIKLTDRDLNQNYMYEKRKPTSSVTLNLPMQSCGRTKPLSPPLFGVSGVLHVSTTPREVETGAGEEVESDEVTCRFLKRWRNAPREVDAGLAAGSTGAEVPTLFCARNASKRAPRPRLGRSILQQYSLIKWVGRYLKNTILLTVTNVQSMRFHKLVLKWIHV